MYRACQVIYRKTPYQMVMELIEEGWNWPARRRRHKEWTWVELEAELKAVRAFQIKQWFEMKQ